MKQQLKNLLEHLSPKETREIVENHCKEIEVDEDNLQVILYIDKTYAYNDLTSSEHIENVKNGVQKAFGDDYETTIKGIQGEEPHDGREENIPHNIHY